MSGSTMGPAAAAPGREAALGCAGDLLLTWPEPASPIRTRMPGAAGSVVAGAGWQLRADGEGAAWKGYPWSDASSREWRVWGLGGLAGDAAGGGGARRVLAGPEGGAAPARWDGLLLPL